MTLACLGIGIGAARSAALGSAYLLRRNPVEITPRWVPESDVEAEITRFKRALVTAREELKAVRHQIPSSTPLDIAEFIDTHLLMLEDTAITEAPVHLIRNQLCSAEWALQIRRDALARVFEEMDDEYLRTRRDDVDHVVSQIQKILLAPEGAHMHNGDDLDGRVIIAHDLTPADTILMRHRGIAAFVTEFGGPMSHTAILARSLGIPAVVGVRHITQYLRHGELLVVDGEQGVVLAKADDATLDHYRRRILAYRSRQASLRTLLDQPSVCHDGLTVQLLANIELPEDIEVARDCGAEGVGLYRTEFLYMNRETVPDEEEHLRTYLDVIDGLDGIPVTIRTLDLGADKQVDGRSAIYCPPTCNPALGLRAIRLCLKEPDLFRPQLRAILRASAEAPVRIMIPMLSNLQELLKVREMIEEAKRELRRDGLRFDPDIPLGGMIEIPGAALAAGAFARHLDFLSLGTNDLIQYTLAVDRVDDEVNYLYDPLHPAVLRLIQMTIDAGQAHGISTSMCGEMAGDPRFTRLLLGMGLREFSMEPHSLLEIKRIVRASDQSALAVGARHLLQNLDTADLEQLLESINQE